MDRVLIVKDDTLENSVSIQGWIQALDFWDIRYEVVYTMELPAVNLNIFFSIIFPSVHDVPECMQDGIRMYLKDRNGSLIVSGAIPQYLEAFTGYIRTERKIRKKCHRCIRMIEEISGTWKANDILFFANTYNSSMLPGLDYEVQDYDVTNLRLLGASEEMELIDSFPEKWDGWKESTEPAVIENQAFGGKVIYIPLPIGAIDWVKQPVVTDIDFYPYKIRNNGIVLFIKNLLEHVSTSGTKSIYSSSLWPDNAKCVVCLTGDVHEYENIKGRCHREYRDMIDNFNILREYGLEGKATYIISGKTADYHPEAINEGISRGYDLCPHTYEESLYHLLNWGAEQQREDILKCTKAFRNICDSGDSYLKGFRTHGYQSNYVTREVLEQLGFLWISDMQMWSGENMGSNIPAQLKMYVGYPQSAFSSRGRRLNLIEIPDTVPNDHFVYRVMDKSAEDAFVFWKKCFDDIYALGGLFQTCWHPYISTKEGTNREMTFRGMLEYMKSFPGVLFLTMDELAEWWAERSRYLNLA